MDWKNFLAIAMVFMFIMMPVGAMKIDDSMGINRQISSERSVNNNLNVAIHANKYYTGKFNNKNAKTYTVTNKPKNGQVTLNKNGKFIYKPNKNFVGKDYFKYRFYNGKTYSNIFTVIISVTNNPPVLKDVSIKTHVNIQHSGKLEGEDRDKDSLNYKLVSNSINGTVKLNSNGFYTYTPNNNFMGVDSFSYVANDGITDSKISTVKINITNNPPVVNDINAEFHSNTNYTGKFNSNDIDGDKLTYNITSGPKYGLVVLNDDGTYTYKPTKNFIGTVSFSYLANDGISDSNTATVTLTVNNSKPVSNNINITSYANTKYTGKLNSTDSDQDVLTYYCGVHPKNGVLKIKTDGSFVYIPNDGFVGEDSFSYQAYDGFKFSEKANVTMNIVNNPPVAYNQNVSTKSNKQYNGKLNVSDLDNNELTYEFIISPKHGSLSADPDGTFNYLPYNGFAGEDSFCYIVNDGVDSSNLTNVTINVSNDPPVAYNQNVSTLSSTQYNGKLNVSDLDKNELTYDIVALTKHGSVCLNPDGTFNYFPNKGFVGVDSFSYIVNDGVVNSNAANVTINVTTHPPIVNDGEFVMTRDMCINGTLSGKLVCSDYYGYPLTYEIVEKPKFAEIVILNDKGDFQYILRKGYIGDDYFTYKVNNGVEDSKIATVNIRIRWH